MDPTLDFFIQSYNNASNDTYLFRVQKLLRSQIQWAHF
uniref:Cystatin like 1 n=1 Tax=Propithecus coquereli TaxID=379532 RepID=A0A2K6F897_PROCO